MTLDEIIIVDQANTIYDLKSRLSCLKKQKINNDNIVEFYNRLMKKYEKKSKKERSFSNKLNSKQCYDRRRLLYIMGLFTLIMK